MDISALSTQEKSEQGQVLTIVHPETNEVFLGFNDEVVTITLKGADCKDFIAMQHRQTNKAIRNGRVTAKSEQLAEDSLRALAKMTISWTAISADGELLPCNEANAMALYKNNAVVKKQVDDFINETGNWMGNV